MDKFSERLVALRKEKDLTQAEFARLCGKQRTTVSGYETEGKEPDFALLCQMADYFGVTTDYLLGLSNQRQPPAGQRETGQTGCLTRMEKSRPKMKACCDRKHGESGQQGANGPEHRT